MKSLPLNKPITESLIIPARITYIHPKNLKLLRNENTSDAARAAFGVFCLTTVYPTDTTGAHGNSGGKSAGKDVFPSGKGRKRPEISGNRYSGFLWELDAAGSSPVTSTKTEGSAEPSVFFYSPCKPSQVFYVSTL